MHKRVAIVYNEPRQPDSETTLEEKAVLDVLDAVDAVRQALLELGFSVTLVPLLPLLEQIERELANLDTDLVFNLFEGFFRSPESEPIVPDILSGLGIPFTGCPASALRLALDKAKTKLALVAAGIKTPDFQLLNPRTLHLFRLNYPCIVKPRCEDASNGLSADSVVHDSASLARQLELVTKQYGRDALVEEFIAGREFNATVIGNSRLTVLPVSEIVYSLPPSVPKILTFDAKWDPNSSYFQGTKPICPAEIEPEIERYIVETVTKVYRLLGCQGYARVDMRMDDCGFINVIEVNPNPDISPDAGAPMQARAAGMTYTQFIAKIVQLAFARKEDERQHSSYVPRRQSPRNGNTARHTRIQTL